jgi:uncharacterized protein YodC (DUF2158 family)
MNTLKVGYVVCLKNDVTSPSMTVVELQGDLIKCFWFDDGDNLHDGVFPFDTLELLDGEEEEEETEAEY